MADLLSTPHHSEPSDRAAYALEYAIKNNFRTVLIEAVIILLSVVAIALSGLYLII
jgi:hypothetical protein